MARKSMSLEEWCHKNGRDTILEEWDYEKNKSMGLAYTPPNIEYNKNFKVAWKCKMGHGWGASTVARTLFNMNCPVCNPDSSVLPIGTQYGCLTIIGNSDEELVNHHDYTGRHNRGRKYYKCQCKCGKIQDIDEFHFMETKHRFCTEKPNKYAYGFGESLGENECGLRRKQQEKLLSTYDRIKDESYDIDYVGTIHESLEVLECINDDYKILSGYTDKRKKGGGYYKVYKKYKCRCYLCGKEQEIISSDLSINGPTEYGGTAYNGYYSYAYCDCHEISSFQWIVNKLLKDNNVEYRVEISFPDLYGTGHTNLLRYDFAVFNDDNSIKCLIECQGEQHFKPVDEFGGERQLKIQQRNDELKRIYVKENNIPLLEIPYTSKKYEKIEEILKLNKLI